MSLSEMSLWLQKDQATYIYTYQNPFFLGGGVHENMLLFLAFLLLKSLLITGW